MAVVESRSVAAASDALIGQPGSYVEWGAIFAGAVAALAVSFVLLSFGAAAGLSAVSPWTSASGHCQSRDVRLGLVDDFILHLGVLAGRIFVRTASSSLEQ